MNTNYFFPATEDLGECEVLLQGGNFNVSVREKIDKWIDEHEGAYYIKYRGRTILNGRDFYNTICFASKEDKLLFVLTFSDIVFAR